MGGGAMSNKQLKDRMLYALSGDTTGAASILACQLFENRNRVWDPLS